MILLASKEVMSLGLSQALFGVVVGLAFGMLLGLFFYSTYRKPYYWFYSLFSGVAGSLIAPILLSVIVGGDSSSIHFVVFQFTTAGIAAFLGNFYLYTNKKRLAAKHKSRRRRTRSRYASNTVLLQVVHEPVAHESHGAHPV
ncbi:MAG: hypothetical protein ABI444_06895 [Candidatus Kapaibacterium sp.]|jgi:hypothetical protein